MRRFKVFVVEDPRLTAERGKSIALEQVIRERAGNDLLTFTAFTRRQVATIEVKDKTEIDRLVDPTKYSSICPAVVRIDLEEEK